MRGGERVCNDVRSMARMIVVERVLACQKI